MRYETKGKRNIDLGYDIPENKELSIIDNTGSNPSFITLGNRKVHITSKLPEYIDVELVDKKAPSNNIMKAAGDFAMDLGLEVESIIKKQNAIRMAFADIIALKQEIEKNLYEKDLQISEIYTKQDKDKQETDGVLAELSNGVKVNADDIQKIYAIVSELNQKAIETDVGLQDVISVLSKHEHPKATKESVGLGNADNTSDIDKPISKATQNALDTKVSVEEFNDLVEKITKLQKKQKDFQRGIDSLGGMGIGTVNLEGGKKGQVLVKKSSQNGDFEWRDSTTQIDDELSLTSEYPVQNKVITSSIIIKSKSIPTATQELVGTEYQYTGETNQTYTHGYIYECVEKTNYTPRISFDPSKIGFDYDKDLIGFFSEATPNYEQIKSGVFEYLEGGDIWSISAKDENGDIIFSEYKLYTDDLRDAGFVFLFPSYEDEEKIDYEFALNPSSSYEWERLDVQPNSSIPDLDEIRAGAALGATSLQPSDVIDNINSTATNKPLSANMGKSLQDQVDNLKARGRFLALWDSTTGLAQSNPPESPYTYKTGDYFIVGNVGSTNYKPDGASYTTGVASSVVETAEVSVDDVYYYDGSDWRLQQNTQKTLSFINIAGSPYDNTNLASALNDKQNELTAGTGISITNDTISVDFNDVATATQGAKADTSVQPSDLNNYVPTSRTVNGKALSSDISLNYSDVGAGQPTIIREWID